MPSVLITVFVLQLAIHLVNTLGAAAINNVLWNIFNRLPLPTSKDAAEQKKLQKEFLRLRKELNATSSQDEFAKWAKLRRQHDKTLEELEKKKAAIDKTKAIFDRSVSTLRWLSTNGLRTFMQFWYSKEPVFWLPQGWVPYYGEWFISLPRAPLGSVSIQAWYLACESVILLVSDVIVAVVGLVMKASPKSAQKPQVPIKSAGGKAGAGAAFSESKKEL